MMARTDHCRNLAFHDACFRTTGVKPLRWGAKSLTIAENYLSRGVRNLVDEC